jgi:hypothetical protein
LEPEPFELMFFNHGRTGDRETVRREQEKISRLRFIVEDRDAFATVIISARIKVAYNRHPPTPLFQGGEIHSSLSPPWKGGESDE